RAPRQAGACYRPPGHVSHHRDRYGAAPAQLARVPAASPRVAPEPGMALSARLCVRALPRPRCRRRPRGLHAGCGPSASHRTDSGAGARVMTGSASAGCSADESDSAANPVDPEPEAQGSPGDEAPADPEHLAAGGDPVITDDAQAEPA